MDNDAALNVQNSFFNQARKDRSRVTILLTGGQQVSGVVRAFDRFTLLLDSDSGDRIVFKHAIASVSLEDVKGP
ncbi:MAG TPA: RNA chaperone Hfq [Candidatus Polarisedimenticolia bacterium]|jgi:host factor-I protein